MGGKCGECHEVNRAGEMGAQDRFLMEDSCSGCVHFHSFLFLVWFTTRKRLLKKPLFLRKKLLFFAASHWEKIALRI